MNTSEQLYILEHSSICRNQRCSVHNCKQMQILVKHFAFCQHFPCICCSKMTELTKLHSFQCNTSQCAVAKCNAFKSSKKLKSDTTFDSNHLKRKIVVLPKKAKSNQTFCTIDFVEEKIVEDTQRKRQCLSKFHARRDEEVIVEDDCDSDDNSCMSNLTDSECSSSFLDSNPKKRTFSSVNPSAIKPMATLTASLPEPFQNNNNDNDNFGFDEAFLDELNELMSQTFDDFPVEKTDGEDCEVRDVWMMWNNLREKSPESLFS